MQIHLNGNPETFEENSLTIDVLLKNKSIAPSGIAVAVNNEIIPFKNWDSFSFKENDNVLIIQATQGG